MLQEIREKSQGLLAWIIVILLIATFALWGIHSYVDNTNSGTALAYVNGQSITQNQVDASYQRMRQQQQIQLGADFSLNPQAETALKKQALGQLILSEVLINAAQKSGYRVTTSQVDQALLKIPAFQQNGQFSIERFHDVLNGMMYTQDQFLAQMRTSMLINQVQGGYINSAFVLPNEIDQAIKLVNQKRDISYLIIPASSFNKNITVPSSEVEAYYKSHQNQYQSPEQVSIEYLQLSLMDIKNKLHFDKVKLQQYYETNIQNYTQPVQWHVAAIFLKIPENSSRKTLEKIQKRAEDIADRIKSGEDFAKLAEQYSEDNPSARHGGELDWFSAGTLDPAFEKAVANLQKPGDISGVVKTGYGFDIIKLLGEKKAKALPFEEVESKVKNALAQKLAEQAFSDESDKLQNLAYANPDSLEVAAKALNLGIQTTDLFDREGTKSGITSNIKILTAAFSNEVLHNGDNSDLIQLDPNTMIVLRVKSHKPAAVLPLADVQNAIQITLRNEMAKKEAKIQGEKLTDLIRQHKSSLADLSHQYNYMLQEEKNAGRYDTKVDAAILNQAFKMPHPSDASLSLKGLTLPSGDYALITVNRVYTENLSDMTHSNMQQRIFKEELESGYGHFDEEFYVRGLMKKAKIKFNQNAALQKDDLPAS